jgi:hypothetical protein
VISFSNPHRTFAAFMRLHFTAMGKMISLLSCAISSVAHFVLGVAIALAATVAGFLVVYVVMAEPLL